MKRTATESGHRRKFLVIVDDTPECGRAVLYAARRAEHTGGSLMLLYVIGVADFQHWLGVENIMRAEAMEGAETTLGRFADLVREKTGIEPQLEIREGNRTEQIIQQIEDDGDIAILVLAAGTDSDGPGPLVSAMTGRHAGSFPIPITVVPGSIEESTIDAIA